MESQMRAAPASLSTVFYRAQVRFVHTVGQPVDVTFGGGRKPHPATGFRTGKRLFSGMASYMDVQILLVGKAVAAARKSAQIRLVRAMGSQMALQVEPGGKLGQAALERAEVVLLVAMGFLMLQQVFGPGKALVAVGCRAGVGFAARMRLLQVGQQLELEPEAGGTVGQRTAVRQ